MGLKLNKYKYEGINITSFQETNKQIIHDYLKLTNNLLNVKMVFYIQKIY